MTEPLIDNLKKTPLYTSHCEMGARMMTFGGWEMPMEYSGITEEHIAVRTKAGLFDVSHMGEIEIAGSQALQAIQKITSNDASELNIGQVQYSALTTHRGTFLDDLLVYRLAETHFLLVLNAINIDKGFSWINKELETINDAFAVNTSSRYALLAIQGPKSASILQELTTIELDKIKYYRFTTGELAGIRATISRTGYTGEDGFEVFVAPQSVKIAWEELLKVGSSVGLLPAGLAARDTLRLESSMRLYGHEINEKTTILEAGLEWVIGWNKPSFNGREALVKQKGKTLERKLVGFEMIDRGIARHGYDIYGKDQKIGMVTSGTQTPFLKKAIGMAYVPDEWGKVETEFLIDTRGRRLRARVVSMPFYSRPKG